MVLLANVPHNEYQIKKTIGYDKYEVFDFSRSYTELVFPYCNSTFYSPDEIEIDISLGGKREVALEGYIKTSYGEAQVFIIFAPTKEIGRVLSMYKNAILKYNPRNYLTLQKSKVNREIERSITSSSSRKTNDFAILNNGVTILASDFNYEPHTGDKNRGRLILIRAQIINGGQTAYTLSKIYQDQFLKNPHVFDGKEVLLRIIKMKKQPADPATFIEDISNATNRQNRVKEADRSSNHQSLVDIQTRIYADFGYFLERKAGEFQEAKERKVLKRDYVINREEFVQAYTAFCGKPSAARREVDKLFTKDQIAGLFPKASVAPSCFFAYQVYQKVSDLVKQEKKNNYGEATYGFGLRYGKFAIVAAVGAAEKIRLSGHEDFESLAKDRVNKILSKWKDFENKVENENKGVFLKKAEGFDNYYKGGAVDNDISKYFG